MSCTSYDDVAAQAAELVAMLSGIARLLVDPGAEIAMAHVEYADEGQPRHVFLSPMGITAGATVSTGLVVGHASGNTPTPFSPLNLFSTIGMSNPTVRKVIRLWGKSQHDWTDLYRIYEVIAKDVGPRSLPARQWVPEPQLDRFTHTANAVPGVESEFDNSRHGSSKASPPPNPMSLHDATGLIQSLVFQWLQEKIRQAEG